MDNQTQESCDKSKPDHLKVKPRLSQVDGIVLIVGMVIGSGIFIAPKGALFYSGSVGMSLVIWTVCGVISAIFGLVYAELGVLLPRSGGDYMYIKAGISPVAAFLVSWVYTLIIGTGLRALLALTFADYLLAPIFGSCGPPTSIRKTLAVVKLLSIAMTNTISVRLVNSAQWLFTILKVTALLIIIVGGIVHIGKGNTEHFEGAFEGTKTNVTSIALAIYNCLWAFGGYHSLNEIAEELKFPKRKLPRAVLAAITLITSIYVLANVSYCAVLTKTEFLTSSAVAYDWAEKVIGSVAIIIPIGVVMSVYGAANGFAMAQSRVRFAASRAGHLPEVMSFLHHKTRIPIVALWFDTLCAVVMVIPADIQQLINLVSFVSFIVMGLSFVSCFRLRHLAIRQGTVAEFRLPVIIPGIAVLMCIAMVIGPLVNDPQIEFLYGALIIAAGLLFYFPFVYFRLRMPGFDHVTLFLQLVMDVCPTVHEDQLQDHKH